MTGFGTRDIPLKWDVFVTPGIAGTRKTARELYDRMVELYSERVNRGLALWLSASAAKP